MLLRRMRPRAAAGAGAAGRVLLAGALLLALAAPAAAGKGIRLLNATQIDSLLSKPVPEPVPHNQTAVEKKATLFREIVHLPDGGRQKPYFALNEDKAILVNTLCDQVLPVNASRDSLSPAGRAYVKQVQRLNGDGYNKTVGTSLSMQSKCIINSTTGLIDCRFDLSTFFPQFFGLWSAAHPKADAVNVTGCSVFFDGSTQFSPDCFQGASPPKATFTLSSATPETAIRDIHVDIHFTDAGLTPPKDVTLRYTHCQAAYNDYYPTDWVGFTPKNQELVNDYRILGLIPRLGEFGNSGSLWEHGRETPALKSLVVAAVKRLEAKANATNVLKAGLEG